MVTNDIVKELSRELDVPAGEAKNILSATLETLREVLSEDKGVTIPGFGTFGSNLRKPRKSYNPSWKKYVTLPAMKIIFFHPGASMKKKIKSKKVSS